MTACALGITRPSALPVGGLTIEPVQRDLALLMDPTGASSPLDRLERCISFHAKCPALLPFSPRSHVTVQAARTYVLDHGATLDAQLVEASELVEMHASVSLDGVRRSEPCDGPALGGRAWLLERQARADGIAERRSAVERWLRPLLQGIAHAIVPLGRSDDDASLAFHIPANKLDDVRQALAQPEVSRARPRDVKGPILVSGPWPLFSFRCGVTAP